LAALYGHLEMTTLLLENEANVEAKTKVGYQAKGMPVNLRFLSLI